MFILASRKSTDFTGSIFTELIIKAVEHDFIYRINLAQDWDQKRAVVNKVTHILIP